MNRQSCMNFIKERRGRAIGIALLVMIAVSACWRIAWAAISADAPPIDGKSADTIILGIYVYFIERDRKRSNRIMTEAIKSKRDSADCDRRHS